MRSSGQFLAARPGAGAQLRELRDAVLDVLKDLRRTADQQLETIEVLCSKEVDEEEEEEDLRERGCLS